MNKIRFFAFLFLISSSQLAHAGFEESAKAIQEKDYQTALSEARKGADANDPRAYYLLGEIYKNGLGVDRNPSEAVNWYQKAATKGVVVAVSKLAMAYSRGEGVVKDKDKALALARLAAKNQDPEGLFLVYLFLNNEYLNYFNSKGQPDNEKYQKLANRAITDRMLDIEAFDSLYLSAGKGNPLAISMLALTLGARIGDDNRKKMDELLSQVPNNMKSSIPGLQAYSNISKQMDLLGNSYASPQLFSDSQASGMTAAMIQGCGLDKEKAKKTTPKLISTRVVNPSTNNIYLMSSVSEYKKSYLISGYWDEEWKYEACDKPVAINVKFLADGLGGAKFSIVQSGKDIPGISKE